MYKLDRTIWNWITQTWTNWKQKYEKANLSNKNGMRKTNLEINEHKNLKMENMNLKRLKKSEKAKVSEKNLQTKEIWTNKYLKNQKQIWKHTYIGNQILDFTIIYLLFYIIF